jgi:hypothetical protein
MFAYTDSRGMDMQPKEFTDSMTPEIFWTRIMLFVVYIMLGTFIMMNMFIGVVVSTFSTIKALNSENGNEGGAITTVEQQEWQRTKEAMMKLKARVKVQDVPSSCSAWIVHTANRLRTLCGKSNRLQPGVWLQRTDKRWTNPYQRRNHEAVLPPLSVAPLSSSKIARCLDRAACAWRYPFFYLVQKLKCIGPASDGRGGRPQRYQWSFPYSLLAKHLDALDGSSKWKDGKIIDIATASGVPIEGGADDGANTSQPRQVLFSVVNIDLSSSDHGTEYRATEIRPADASTKCCGGAASTAELAVGDLVEFKHATKHWLQKLPVLDFDTLIMACIIANTVVMAMGYYGMSAAYAGFIDVMNLVFAAIFTVEAAIKLIAFGLDKYFDDNWNIFDFAIVVGTIAGLLAKWITGSDAGSVATVIRTFRIGRVFRMVKRLGNLRVLFQSIILSLPALMNVGIILVMAMFIFAILGVQLFAKLEMPEDGTLGGYNHFMTFWSSLLLLLRALTGEAWPDMMYEMGSPSSFLLAAPTAAPTLAPTVVNQTFACPRWTTEDRADPPYAGMESVCGFKTSSEPEVNAFGALFASVNPYHDPYSVECCPIHGNGNLWVAWFFWLAFNLIIPTVMVELIVFYILESFLDQSNDEASVVDLDMQDAIATAWEEVDPDGDGYVSRKGLIAFFRHLDEPMGFHKGMRDLVMLEAIHSEMMIIPKMHRGTKQYWYPDVSRGIARKIDTNWTKDWDAADRRKDVAAGLEDDASAMTSVLQMLEVYRTYRFRRALQLSITDYHASSTVANGTQKEAPLLADVAEIDTEIADAEADEPEWNAAETADAPVAADVGVLNAETAADAAPKYVAAELTVPVALTNAAALDTGATTDAELEGAAEAASETT